jgi:hypothetical protein
MDEFDRIADRVTDVVNIDFSTARIEKSHSFVAATSAIPAECSEIRTECDAAGCTDTVTVVDVTKCCDAGFKISGDQELIRACSEETRFVFYDQEQTGFRCYSGVSAVSTLDSEVRREIGTIAQADEMECCHNGVSNNDEYMKQACNVDTAQFADVGEPCDYDNRDGLYVSCWSHLECQEVTAGAQKTCVEPIPVVFTYAYQFSASSRECWEMMSGDDGSFTEYTVDPYFCCEAAFTSPVDAALAEACYEDQTYTFDATVAAGGCTVAREAVSEDDTTRRYVRVQGEAADNEACCAAGNQWDIVSLRQACPTAQQPKPSELRFAECDPDNTGSLTPTMGDACYTLNCDRDCTVAGTENAVEVTGNRWCDCVYHNYQVLLESYD